MSKWAYEMSNEDLLNEFMNACGKAGVSNSGLIIDLSGGGYLAEAHYLRSVLDARLDGQRPIFQREERVVLKKDAHRPVRSLNTVRGRGYTSSIAREGYVHRIWRVYYEGEGRWSLSFEDDRDFRFPAEAYEKTELRADAPPVKAHYYEPDLIGFDADSE